MKISLRHIDSVTSKKHEAKRVKVGGYKRSQSSPAQVIGKRARSQVIEEAGNEIRKAGLKNYCSVLSF
jgi:hypothetical protein